VTNFKKNKLNQYVMAWLANKSLKHVIIYLG